MYLRFSHYGQTIAKSGLVSAVRAASQDLKHRQGSPIFDTRIARPLAYEGDEQSVEIRLLPYTLTWRQWHTALSAVKDFYRIWDPVTLMFDLCNAQGEMLGRWFVWYLGFLGK